MAAILALSNRFLLPQLTFAGISNGRPVRQEQVKCCPDCPHIGGTRIAFAFGKRLWRLESQRAGSGRQQRERIHFFGQAEITDARAQSISLVTNQECFEV